MRFWSLLTAFMFVVVVTNVTHVPVSGQTQRVDFARDVQPLLKQHCVECHSGPEPRGGYRLDRRSGALGGVTRPNILPRSSESSRLYRRLIGNQFGAQMPPKGPLAAHDVDVIKRWIDEGAEWPVTLANEVDLPKEEPAAVALIEQIRAGRHEAVRAAIGRDASVVNRRGPGGATPLMYAALYADAALVSDMLQRGGDPNARSHVGSTALMWALENPASVLALLERGADVNVTSDFGRTPLLVAAQLAPLESVSLLLGRGAPATPAALTAAANRANAAVMRALIAAGARDTNGAAAVAARRTRCGDCVEALAAVQSPTAARASLLNFVPTGAGNGAVLAEAIAAGANVNERDVRSKTVAILASIHEELSVESVRLLVARGADLSAKDPDGFTALDWARRMGRTPVVDALVGAGASEGTPIVAPAISYVRENSVPAAIRRSLPLLQRTGLQFYERSGCLSCHHNSQTAMTVAAARLKNFAVDEASARTELSIAGRDVETTREQTLQGIFTPGGTNTTFGYILLGLAAEKHAPDAATDSMVRLLRLSQLPDGSWRSTFRPPFESSLFTAGATVMRAIQVYGGTPSTDANERSVRAAALWMERTPAVTTEDHVFKLLGLTWSKAPTTSRNEASRALRALQRADGGWAQLTTMESDAYATGSALVALHEAGVSTDDAAYRRGVEFLLRTQATDGSWFVRSRSHPTQIYFESGFPYGVDQYISTAATNWATLALIHAAPADRR
jgi:ankyrin repeat protein